MVTVNRLSLNPDMILTTSKEEFDNDLNTAKALFKDLRAGKVLGAAAEEIRTIFERWGIDASVLDETGQKDKATMEKELADAEEYADIKGARTHLKFLKEGKETADLALDNIEYLLKKHKKPISALDETGQKNDAQAQEDLDSTAKTAYLRDARNYLEVRKARRTGPEDDKNTIKMVGLWLKGAGAPDSAVDGKNLAELENVLKSMEAADQLKNKDKQARNEGPSAANPPLIASVQSSLGKDGNTPS